MSFGIGELQRSLYHTYRRRLDMRAVLDHYGAQNCSEQLGKDGTTEVIHSCILDRIEPHHAHGDAHPSAAANLDKKLYCCYSYWSGDVFHLLAKMENKQGFDGIVPLLSGFLSEATVPTDTLLAELDKAFVVQSSYSVELPSYSDKVLEPWLVPHPYWAKRGISAEAIATLRLGYDDRERRVVFPHFIDGQLVGWQKRITPDSKSSWPKYRSSLGLPKAETLYNYDIASQYRQVVVVESPMSVARAVSLGFPSVVATFGAGVAAHQIDLLKGFESVRIWFDDDSGGRSGERKLVRGLYRHTDVQVVIPEKGKDMADVVDDRHLCSCLLSAVPAALRLADYDAIGGPSG